jgi:hypothetical protein
VFIVVTAVASTPDERRSEGKTLLLVVVGLLVVFFVGVPLWIVRGAKQGPLPYIPANPAAIVFGGQKIAFKAGDLAVGDSLLCENFGVLVGAKVPKPGHTTHAQFVGSEHTATIKIHMRDDGVVIARCP